MSRYKNGFKIEVINYYNKGHSTNETLDKFGIGIATLFRWLKESNIKDIKLSSKDIENIMLGKYDIYSTEELKRILYSFEILRGTNSEY